jgi:outer membrane lipopolysaccharide assembly protein LptE/RlpB
MQQLTDLCHTLYVPLLLQKPQISQLPIHSADTERTLTTQFADGDERENRLTATLSAKLLNGVVYLIQKPTHDRVRPAEFDEHHRKVLFYWLHKINLQQ